MPKEVKYPRIFDCDTGYQLRDKDGTVTDFPMVPTGIRIANGLVPGSQMIIVEWDNSPPELLKAEHQKLQNKKAVAPF